MFAYRDYKDKRVQLTWPKKEFLIEGYNARIVITFNELSILLEQMHGYDSFQVNIYCDVDGIICNAADSFYLSNAEVFAENMRGTMSNPRFRPGHLTSIQEYDGCKIEIDKHNDGYVIFLKIEGPLIRGTVNVKFDVGSQAMEKYFFQEYIEYMKSPVVKELS